MKKIFLFVPLAFVFTSCVSDDGGCGCVPPPGNDQELLINVQNKSGDNLLLSSTIDYIPEDNLAFFLLTRSGSINLTKDQRNSSIIRENNPTSDKYISLRFGWYMEEQNGIKEGNYVIDYGGLYPNDTIYTKYKVTPWEQSDPLLEVKLNGVSQQLDSDSNVAKSITIIK